MDNMQSNPIHSTPTIIPRLVAEFLSARHLGFLSDNGKVATGPKHLRSFYVPNVQLATDRAKVNYANLARDYLKAIKAGKLNASDLNWVSIYTPWVMKGFKARLSGGILKSVIEDEFRKQKRLPDFDTSIDFDGVFTAISSKLFKKSPVYIDDTDRDDMIIDAFVQVVTADTVKKFDPNQTKIVQFFGRMFENRLKNILKSFVTKKLKEDTSGPFDPDESEEEFRDRRDMRDRPDNPEKNMSQKELLTGITKFLKKQRNKRLPTIFEELQDGKSNKEVAEQLGVSPAIITRDLKELKDAFIQFAKATGNKLLENLTTDLINVRKSSEADILNPNFEAADDWGFEKLMREYKRQNKSARKPSGEINTIVKTRTKDLLDPSFLSAVVLNDEVAPSESAKDSEAFLDFIEAQDDLIEVSDGNLVGLRVMDKPRAARGYTAVAAPKEMQGELAVEDGQPIFVSRKGGEYEFDPDSIKAVSRVRPGTTIYVKGLKSGLVELIE